MYRKILIFIALSVCVLSCSERRFKNELAKFMSQKIVIPQDLQAVVQGNDSCVNQSFGADVQLIVWYDSLGCSSCKVGHLQDWDNIVVLNKATRGRFKPVFIFSPAKNKSRELLISLKTSLFDYPVHIDSSGVFQTLNPNLPTDTRFHTFLLDKNNRVVMVGDPSNNAELWKLYKTTIKELVNNGGVLKEVH